MPRFMNLDVWNLGMDLAVEVYKLTKEFPKQEDLRSEIRRTSAAIPSHIAQGAGTNNDTAFHLLLDHASSSAARLITQAILAKRAGFITSAESDILVDKAEHIMNSIVKLQAKLQPKSRSGKKGVIKKK